MLFRSNRARNRRQRRDDRKAARAEAAQNPRRVGHLRGDGGARREQDSEGWNGTSPPVIARTRPREERSGSRSCRGGRNPEGDETQGRNGRDHWEHRWFAIGKPDGSRQRTSGGIKTGQPGEGLRDNRRPAAEVGGQPPTEAPADGKPVEATRRGRADLRKGKPPKGVNPMSVTGTKQGWRAPGGSNRQEGVKPCRRMGPVWKSGSTIPGAENAVGEGTSREWLHSAGSGAAFPAKL